jgi:hypothetical protein
MAFPSLVITIPPMGSKSILSIDLGPRVVLTISATALPALILEIYAFLPYSLLVLLFKTTIGLLPPFYILDLNLYPI